MRKGARKPPILFLGMPAVCIEGLVGRGGQPALQQARHSQQVMMRRLLCKGPNRPAAPALTLTSQSRAPKIWVALGEATWLTVWVAISAAGVQR